MFQGDSPDRDILGYVKEWCSMDGRICFAVVQWKVRMAFESTRADTEIRRARKKGRASLR